MAITIGALFLYTLAELHIAPLIDSLIARIVNRRFLAIGYGSRGLIALGIGYLFTFLVSGIYWLTGSTLYVGLGIFLLIAFVLIIKKSSFK